MSRKLRVLAKNLPECSMTENEEMMYRPEDSSCVLAQALHVVIHCSRWTFACCTTLTVCSTELRALRNDSLTTARTLTISDCAMRRASTGRRALKARRRRAEVMEWSTVTRGRRLKASDSLWRKKGQFRSSETLESESNVPEVLRVEREPDATGRHEEFE